MSEESNAMKEDRLCSRIDKELVQKGFARSCNGVEFTMESGTKEMCDLVPGLLGDLFMMSIAPPHQATPAYIAMVRTRFVPCYPVYVKVESGALHMAVDPLGWVKMADEEFFFNLHFLHDDDV